MINIWANLEPKTNHTKGRWCTPATSQSMSAAAGPGSEWGAGPKRWSVLHNRREQNHGVNSTPSYTSGSSTSDNTTKDKDHILAFALVHLVMKGTGHTGVGCPKLQGMQPVFWISCFTSSFPSTGVPSAPETCGWLHSIPQETHSSYSHALRMLWGWLAASFSQQWENTKAKTTSSIPLSELKMMLGFNVRFLLQNVAEKLFYYMTHIILFRNGHHSFYSC